jgi:hypothetical protein
MTYSYLLSVPLLIAYSVGFTVIKYREGFVMMPGMGVIPKPYQLWNSGTRAWIFPLYFLFSSAWALEMVTHLEELCFWLFLINAGSAQQDWFRSMYFKTWVLGSICAVALMPMVTIFTRQDPLKCEAYTFLSGSLGSLSLTIWFLPVLWTFPSFLKNLKREGVDTATMVRLTKFHELNTLRVLFRFMFCVPLITLGIDGVRAHHHVNESMLITDVLAAISAFGVLVSSAITLVIFFPRSIESEINSRETNKELKRPRVYPRRQSTGSTARSMLQADYASPDRLKPLASERPSYSANTMSIYSQPEFVTENPFSSSYKTPDHAWEEEHVGSGGGKRRPGEVPVPSNSFKPNRRAGNGEVELGSVVMGSLTEGNLSQHNLSLRQSKYNAMVHNFRSPIDLAYYEVPPMKGYITQ